MPGPPELGPLGVFRRFLRFGLLAWGGPVAQIAMVRRALVDEERWISQERFNRVLAVYQALPGPEAHELCVYLGRLTAGTAGGLAAGLGFMLPGLLGILALSWAYVRLGLDVAGLAGPLLGAQAAVLALVARGVADIGRHALTSPVLWVVALATLAGDLAGAHFAILLLGAGVVGALASRRWWWWTVAAAALVAATVAFVPGLRSAEVLASIPAGAPGPSPRMSELLAAGLATGLLTFGGAYTAVPILRDAAVGPAGWLSTRQFLDGIALGGLLPAPLIIFSTFVGYLGGGLAGALLVTAAVFAPAFAFSLVGFGTLERLVADERLHSFFDGVTAGVVGVIAATTIELVPSVLDSALRVGIALGALVILLSSHRRAAVPLVVLGGGLVGWLGVVATGPGG